MKEHFAQIVFTRDAHPSNHCSFDLSGGPWPPHCVRGTMGVEFHPEMPLPPSAWIIDKGTEPDREAYSGFDGTDLGERLRHKRIERVFVCGLATDYCVRATVLDSLRAGLDTWVLIDAIAAVDVHPGDGDRALLEMRNAGARWSDVSECETVLSYHREKTALIVVDVQVDFCPGGSLAVADAPKIFPPLSRLLS